MSAPSLWRLFVDAASKYASRPALQVSGDTYSYAELLQEALALANSIRSGDESVDSPVAVMCDKTSETYVAVLGALAAGRPYLPLSPRSPATRSNQMLASGGARCIVAGPEQSESLSLILASTTAAMTVIVDSDAQARQLSQRFRQHRFTSLRDRGSSATEITGVESRTAYILFTSGSTGAPKAVPVSHSNVGAYLRNTADIFDFSCTDRFSQTFDLTFDLSVHDMFVCWTHGACLCVPTESSRLAPAKYVRDNALTVWFSVPSLIAHAQKLGMLKPSCMPTLRHSLFCGEPLSFSSARAWQRAAPQSQLHNLYGPTETTIAVSRFTLPSTPATGSEEGDFVPLGWPFSRQQVCLIDQNLSPVPDECAGELCITGTQVTNGYIGDPERTAQSFVQLPQAGQGIWYRTGDSVRRDRQGCLHFLGRTDNQVKLRGFRVELEDIDRALRSSAQTSLALCVAWPRLGIQVEAIYGFVETSTLTEAQIVSRCKDLLPDYMVPSRVFVNQKLPLTLNDKLDRQALAARLPQLIASG